MIINRGPLVGGPNGCTDSSFAKDRLRCRRSGVGIPERVRPTSLLTLPLLTLLDSNFP